MFKNEKEVSRKCALGNRLFELNAFNISLHTIVKTDLSSRSDMISLFLKVTNKN